MDDQAMVDAIERALRRLEVEIRREPLSEDARVAGGLCRIEGRTVVFVPDDASLPERRAVLVDALRRLPTEDLWLPPALRRALARCR